MSELQLAGEESFSHRIDAENIVLYQIFWSQRRILTNIHTEGVLPFPL